MDATETGRLNTVKYRIFRPGVMPQIRRFVLKTESEVLHFYVLLPSANSKLYGIMIRVKLEFLSSFCLRHLSRKQKMSIDSKLLESIFDKAGNKDELSLKAIKQAYILEIGRDLTDDETQQLRNESIEVYMKHKVKREGEKGNKKRKRVSSSSASSDMDEPLTNNQNNSNMKKMKVDDSVASKSNESIPSPVNSDDDQSFGDAKTNLKTCDHSDDNLDDEKESQSKKPKPKKPRQSKNVQAKNDSATNQKKPSSKKQQKKKTSKAETSSETEETVITDPD